MRSITWPKFTLLFNFYRVMRYAERGIVVASCLRSSVCCLWRSGIVITHVEVRPRQFHGRLAYVLTLCRPNIMDLLHREHQRHPIISAGTGVGRGVWNKWLSPYETCNVSETAEDRPVETGKGESFPGSRDVWGPRHRSKLPTKIASFWHQISMKSIFWPGSVPDPGGEAYAPQTRSRMMWGHPSQVSFLSTPSASWSRRLRNEVVIEPRENAVSRAPLRLSTGLAGDRANFTINCLYSHSWNIQWLESVWSWIT